MFAYQTRSQSTSALIATLFLAVISTDSVSSHMDDVDIYINGAKTGTRLQPPLANESLYKWAGAPHTSRDKWYIDSFKPFTPMIFQKGHLKSLEKVAKAFFITIKSYSIEPGSDESGSIPDFYLPQTLSQEGMIVTPGTAHTQWSMKYIEGCTCCPSYHTLSCKISSQADDSPEESRGFIVQYTFTKPDDLYQSPRLSYVNFLVENNTIGWTPQEKSLALTGCYQIFTKCLLSVRPFIAAVRAALTYLARFQNPAPGSCNAFTATKADIKREREENTQKAQRTRRALDRLGRFLRDETQLARIASDSFSAFQFTGEVPMPARFHPISDGDEVPSEITPEHHTGFSASHPAPTKTRHRSNQH